VNVKYILLVEQNCICKKAEHYIIINTIKQLL
jgi:hypothetical protein